MNRVLFTFVFLGAAGFTMALAFAPQATAQLPSKVTHPQEQPDQQQQQEQQQQARLVGPTQFDGTYAVEIATLDGTCGPSRGTVEVQHGQVISVSPNTHGIYATGLIEDDGTVSMSFHWGNGDVAHVGGTMKGASGTGAWSSPTTLCGGTWRADREK
jgi:hypothetical protein